MELFTPAWNSKNPEKRMNAVRKITEVWKLHHVAVRSDYEDVQQEAWKRIALEAEDWRVREMAAKKITKNAANNDKDNDNPRCRPANVSERWFPEPFTPAWNSKYPEKRMNTVRKITDMEKLQRIAEKAKYEDVRQEAWKRIALEAKDWEVRKAAVERITDQTVLKHVALTDSDDDVCKAAIERITDEIALVKMALNNKNAEVRMAAIEKVHNPVLLAKIALSEIESIAEAQQHYDATISKISNLSPGTKLLSKEEYLSKIRNNCYAYIREFAVKNINNQAVLKEVVLKDSDSDVRKAAVEKITDQVLLKELVGKITNHSVRYAVVEKITDLALLKDMAVKDSDSWIRELSIRTMAKLTNKSKYDFIAEEGSEAFLDEQIQIMRNSALAHDRKEAILYVVAFYRAGKFVEKIKRWDGKALRSHSDGYDSRCASVHLDTPEIVFQLPPCSFPD